MQKKRNKLRIIFAAILLAILALIILAALIVSWYSDSIYSPASNSGEEVTFTVAPGDSLVSIADELETKGLIRNKDALRIYLRLNTIPGEIKVGVYTIAKNLNIPQIIDTLEKGVFKPAKLITIKEGLRDEEIASLLNSELSSGGEKAQFDYDQFIDIIENPDNQPFSSQNKEFLINAKPEGKPLTGFLFPDTYRIDTDSTAIQVADQLIENLQKRLNEAEIDYRNVNANQTNLKNFYEVLILASIIEKEASANDDSSLISGVFHNRLSDNYLLESDATVNFATGKNLPGATFEDLKIDSPYNTYKYAGLTPTPINNPSIKSIKGAINPAITDFYYFYHSPKGQSYFAKTFAEHQRNVSNNQ